MIDCTVIRGFSDAYGSWNTICILRRNCAQLARSGRVARPARRTAPSPTSARAGAARSRPVVDLPQPDSPTSPSVSPRLDREADAGTRPGPRRPASEQAGADREVLDQVARPRAAARRRLRRGVRGSVIGAHRHDAPSPAASKLASPRRSGTPTSAPGRPRASSRPSSVAHSPGTSAYGQRGWNAQPGGRRSATAADPTMRCSRLFLSIGGRAGAATRAAPRCTGAAARRRCRRPSPSSTWRPAYITMHPVGDAGDHAEVVGDQHDRRARAVLDALEHLEHLGLDGHVERGGRLVGDEQRRDRWRSPSRSSPAAACRPSTRAGTGRPAGSGCGMPTMSSSSITRVRGSLAR